MRVAFIVDAFPMVSETFVREQILGVAERGHEVDIYALDRSPDVALAADERIARLGLAARVRYLTAPRGAMQRIVSARRRLTEPEADRPTLLRSLNVLRFGRDAIGLGLLHRAAAVGKGAPLRFDVIHAQFGPLGHIAVRLRQLGVWRGAVVVSFRGYDATKLLKARPRIYRIAFAEADLLLPVSGALRERLLAHGAIAERVHVHRSGIDCEAFAFRERTRESGEAIRLLSIARLVPKKGIEDAIRAVARLVDRGMDVRYEVVGDGEERPRLGALVEALGLQKRIRFFGKCAHREAIARLASAHVLVAPSVTASDGDEEGIPNAIKEAMASGVPVVATRHGGIPELVEDGRTGWLVAEHDVEALADRIAHLVHHPETWPSLGRAGRAKIEAEYDRRRLNDELEALYLRAIERHRQAGAVAAAREAADAAS